MSFNGFNSRQIESAYLQALYNSVFLLQLRIVKLLKGGKISKLLISNIESFDDVKFGKVLTKLYARLFSFEAQK